MRILVTILILFCTFPTFANTGNIKDPGNLHAKRGYGLDPEGSLNKKINDYMETMKLTSRQASLYIILQKINDTFLGALQELDEFLPMKIKDSKELEALYQNIPDLSALVDELYSEIEETLNTVGVKDENQKEENYKNLTAITSDLDRRLLSLIPKDSVGEEELNYFDEELKKILTQEKYKVFFAELTKKESSN